MKSLYNWLTKRSTGVLMHVSSLPGNTGIGTIGSHARSFIDLLENSGMAYWQICPLGPTGFGDSPYQSFSSYAGNPYFIDLEDLVSQGLLEKSDLDVFVSQESKLVDFGFQWNVRWPILRKAALVFLEKAHETVAFEAFCKNNREWLCPYALFMGLKRHLDGKPWYEWGDDYKTYTLAAKADVPAEVEKETLIQKVLQYLFFTQWENLRAYAKARSIQIIGDLPIFVAMDSADVWADPEVFQLDETLNPKAVAGVPPDYFSPEGQLWGNPLYDWDYLKKTKFAWWIRRVEASMKLYDVVRIDHFRGFDAYWKVPANADTAIDGQWVKAPGLQLFKEIKKALPDALMIAEDLGIIDDSIVALREATGLPGMAVLQFAFDGEDSDYLPHNQKPNCVLYPGTHDNDTTLGWYDQISEDTKHKIRTYLRISGKEIGWDFVRSGYASVCKLFIMPMQDLLNLGSDARMNTPGTAQGNWRWRATEEQLEKFHYESVAYLKDLKRIYYR